jgi:two-component system, response regulator
MTNISAVDILLVEDNPQDSELMLRALKKNHIANNIFTVEDGADAIDFIFSKGKFAGKTSGQWPRVILLDLKLPKINGLEVLKEIKSHEETRSIPVVMVTSSREDPDIKAAYELGANSYVVKPVDFESFQEAMVRVGLYWLLINQR